MSSNDEIRRRLLEILYAYELEHPERAGLEKAIIERELQVPQNLLNFNIFYLRDKNLVTLGALGRYQVEGFPTKMWASAEITAFGIDVVERIKSLEEESKKKDPDESRIKAAWNWLKENASWIVPTLIDLLRKIPPSWMVS